MDTKNPKAVKKQSQTKPPAIKKAAVKSKSPSVAQASAGRSSLHGSGKKAKIVADPSASHPVFGDKDWENIDAQDVSDKAFEWLIHPMTIETFYRDHHEKSPLYIPRHPESIREHASKKTDGVNTTKAGGSQGSGTNTGKKKQKKSQKDGKKGGEDSGARGGRGGSGGEGVDSSKTSSGSGSSSGNGQEYWKGVFSKEDMLELFEKNEVIYGRDVDITSYVNGQRHTLNPEGGVRATKEQVLESVGEGCSVRFLCPQQFSSPLWRLLYLLDGFWGSNAGANTYWTPKGTQGFAPHYDDVDIFVMQTEGAKRWRLYPPRQPNQVLAEVSSRNFKQEEIGEPFLDVVLRKGDFFYAPRGVIHQCVASRDHDSLHVTLSTNMKNSWGNFMREVIPRAIELAVDQNVEFRESLPRGYQDYMGTMHCESEDVRRAEFTNRFSKMLQYIIDSDLLPLDAGADRFAADFMHSRVPPAFSTTEKKLLSAIKLQSLSLDSTIRLSRKGVARVIPPSEEDEAEDGEEKAIVVYTTDNSRLFKGKDMGVLSISLFEAEAVELIINSYPNALAIRSLPLPIAGDEGDEGEGDDQTQEGVERLLALVRRLAEAKIIVIL